MDIILPPPGQTEPHLTLPLVRIYGPHRQMGQQLGEACREQVKISIDNARQLLEGAYRQLQLHWTGARIQARKYLPFAEERYPQYVAEMQGISEGANVAYDDICVLNLMEAITNDALHLTKCTTFAVNQERSADGHVRVAHNEDWLPEDESGVYIIHARPDDEPPFLAMSYGGLLPNIGFNAAGMSQCCDSVYPRDSRIGIPRIIVARAVLAAQTPSEAIDRALIAHRAAGYNHLLVHESGELYNLEVSAKQFGLLYGEDNYLVHTNFYLDPHMRMVESHPEELISTHVRYYRALRLLKQTQLHTLETLQAIQKDHVNYPISICNHAANRSPLDRQSTITALVMDLTTRAMHAAWGNPCQNAYAVFHLDD